MARHTDRRWLFLGVRWVGLGVGIVGAATAVAGAVLPWMRFTVFGVDVSIPGVAGWGAVTLTLAALSVLWGHRLPLVALLFGMTIIGVGEQAERTAGRAVKARILGFQQSLAGVNDRLMRAGLPPVEPFPLGQPWSSYVGVGPRWTAWGGAGLALAGTIVFAAGRLGRKCVRCGAVWSKDRVWDIAFCPACGTRVGPPTACTSCHGALEPDDRFCMTCGTAVID